MLPVSHVVFAEILLLTTNVLVSVPIRLRLSLTLPATTANPSSSNIASVAIATVNKSEPSEIVSE